MTDLKFYNINMAIYTNNILRFRELMLEIEGNDINDRLMVNLLSSTSFQAHREMVEILISKLQNRKLICLRPLINAIKKSRTDIFKLLLDNYDVSDNLNDQNICDGSTLLHIIVQHQNLEALKVMLNS